MVGAAPAEREQEVDLCAWVVAAAEAAAAARAVASTEAFGGKQIGRDAV